MLLASALLVDINPKHLVSQMRLELIMKERILKVIEQYDKGLISESTMWLEIVETADWALDNLEITEIEANL
jgi:hypothetical protein